MIKPAVINESLLWDYLAGEARLGGFTVDVNSRTEPEEGYVFSPYPQFSAVIPTAEFTSLDVESYAEKHRDLLKEPGHYLGGWRRQTADVDEVWLDISVIAPTLADAVMLGTAYGQLAAWDLARNVEVPL